MDQVSEQDREPILERLNTLNPLSSKVFTQNAEVDLRWFTHELKLNVNAILGASIPKGHHHHNHAVGSLAFESQTPLDVEKFEAWLMGLVDEEGMELYRLKGLVDLSDRDQPLIIQAVGCSLEMDDEQVWGERERSTRLVIIGKNLNEAELQRDFKACEV
jgi:G3E family GTPase